MKSFILGLVLGVFVPFIFGALFILTGRMPVAVKSPPLPFEKYIARKSIHAAFHDSLGLKAPFQSDEVHMMEGAKVYRNNCMVCHGNEKAQPTAIAKGLFPRAPQLFHHSVTDDAVGETYWKVKNGIRLTGMPGFEGNLTEDEIWNVSIFLKDADKLPGSVKKFLNQ